MDRLLRPVLTSHLVSRRRKTMGELYILRQQRGLPFVRRPRHPFSVSRKLGSELRRSVLVAKDDEGYILKILGWLRDYTCYQTKTGVKKFATRTKIDPPDDIVLAPSWREPSTRDTRPPAQM